MAMLEGVEELTLERLNTITQAWVEQDVPPQRPQRDRHHAAQALPRCAQRGPSLSDRASRCAAPSVAASSAASAAATAPSAWRANASRSRRAFATSRQLHVAYARWDLSAVELVDPHTGAPLCPLYPLDKAANASAERRRLDAA